jgi:hypothetical protein
LRAGDLGKPLRADILIEVGGDVINIPVQLRLIRRLSLLLRHRPENLKPPSETVFSQVSPINLAIFAERVS